VSQQYIDFAYVKENASFERVIAGYNLKLLGKGPQRSLLCPFHPERKPSCKIDLERNIWHCFGCEAKGNVLEFVARLEGDEDDLRAAALKIAELCGTATAAPREAAGALPAGEHRRKGARVQYKNGGARRTRVARAWGGASGSSSSSTSSCLDKPPNSWRCGAGQPAAYLRSEARPGAPLPRRARALGRNRHRIRHGVLQPRADGRAHLHPDP
jgi:hypothetical protein